MSLARLERAILKAAKIAFKNPGLKMDDIRDYAGRRLKAQPGEAVSRIPDPGIFVSVTAENDKRE
jgi:hypothetical protein